MHGHRNLKKKWFTPQRITQKLVSAFLCSVLEFLKKGSIKCKGPQYPILVTHTNMWNGWASVRESLFVWSGKDYFESSHEDSMATNWQSNPCTGLDRPWGFQEVEIPRISKTIGTESCQTYAPAAFTPPPREYSWYSFLLQSESTPGSQCGRNGYVNEKCRWHHRESNPRPSAL